MRKIILAVATIFFGTGLVVAQGAVPASVVKISNAIKLKLSVGVKLKTAYLFFDGGKRVPESNMADLNQNVNMMVQIDRGGWVERDGIVSIGASEKIITNTGNTILNEPDLFATLTDISADDAQYITLKAVITSMTKKISYFLVTFTIWDKWGSGKITGSYKLKIR